MVSVVSMIRLSLDVIPWRTHRVGAAPLGRDSVDAETVGRVPNEREENEPVFSHFFSPGFRK